jgi:hypothetical protein
MLSKKVEEFKREATLVLNDGVKPSTYGFAIVYPSVVDHIIKYTDERVSQGNPPEHFIVYAIRAYIHICSKISKSRPYPEIVFNITKDPDMYCGIIALNELGLIEFVDDGWDHCDDEHVMKATFRTFRTEY